MKNVDVCPISKVEVRCQFTNIPGVSFLTITHRPQRGCPYTMMIEMLGIKTFLLEEAINGTISKDIKMFQQEPFINLLKPAARNELFDAAMEGLEVLSKMIKSTK